MSNGQVSFTVDDLREAFETLGLGADRADQVFEVLREHPSQHKGSSKAPADEQSEHQEPEPKGKSR